MKKFLRQTIGIILVILGVLALITPFSPGSWLIFVGLGLLGVRTFRGKPFLKGRWKKTEPETR